MKPTLAFVLLAGVFCATLGALPEPIDLGYGYDSNTIEWPGGEKFNYRKVSAGEIPSGAFLAANDFATAEHCGTHLDAPYHFNKNGRKVADIPLDRLITKAVLVDAVKETGSNDSYMLPAAKLDEWVKINGEIPDKSVLLVKFGWSTRYPNREEYLGPSDTDLRFPGLSEDAAKWIVDSKKFVGVGVDCASLDQSKSESFPVHQLVMANDMYGLENVNLNYDLPPVFDLIVMPIKLVNGTGGPARIVGVGVDSPSVDQSKAQMMGVHVKLSAADIYNLENVNLTVPLPPVFDLIAMPIKLVNGTGGPCRIVAH